jgi:hypothetical protein
MKKTNEKSLTERLGDMVLDVKTTTALAYGEVALFAYAANERVAQGDYVGATFAGLCGAAALGITGLPVKLYNKIYDTVKKE